MLCLVFWVAAGDIPSVRHGFVSEKQVELYRKRGWHVDDRTCDALVYSRKLSRRCVAEPSSAYEKLPLLVTGTAGVGTRAIASFLAAMGIDTGHEAYAPATVSWTHAVNDFALGVQYPYSSERTKWWQQRHIKSRVDAENIFKPRFAYVVHVTRCPLRVLGSLLKPHAPIIRFVEKATGITSPCLAYDCDTTLQERLGWALSTYVAWNSHIEKFADERRRVEDVFADLTSEGNRRLCTKALKERWRATCAERLRMATNATKFSMPQRPVLLSLRHVREATFGENVDGRATIETFVDMGRRYGYDAPCVEGDNNEALFWSSRKQQIVATPPVIEDLPVVTKAGIEQCIAGASCSVLEARCPEVPAARDCLRAAVPFRTPYRRLSCCFRCCLRYWLDKATRLGANIRFQAANSRLENSQHNPDSGDFGLDPVHNLLVHPHAFAALSDVRLHPNVGCSLTPAASAGVLNTTIAGLYHFQPDEKMLPRQRIPSNRQVYENDADKWPCVEALRKSRHLIVDVFDPRKVQPGRHLDKRLALFLANNVDNLREKTHRERILERVIGVRGVSLWQALLEHPDVATTFTDADRDRLLLCCCMNVDGMHHGRLEHTKILAKHDVFDCPITPDYRMHHIGRPKTTDPGVHDIEAEVSLMLNDKYGTRKTMSGSYDTHMPVLMLTSKFVYSPNGVGEQCYREYEALVAGAIPVLDNSSYVFRRSLLERLPVVLVNNWSAITPDFLEAKWREFSRRDFDVAVLYLPYWYDKILSAMGS